MKVLNRFLVDVSNDKCSFNLFLIIGVVYLKVEPLIKSDCISIIRKDNEILLLRFNIIVLFC